MLIRRKQAVAKMRGDKWWFDMLVFSSIDARPWILSRRGSRWVQWSESQIVLWLPANGVIVEARIVFAGTWDERVFTFPTRLDFDWLWVWLWKHHQNVDSIHTPVIHSHRVSTECYWEGFPMMFNTIEYGIFLPVVFVIVAVLSIRFRWIPLLAAS